MIKLIDIDKYVESKFQRVFILKGINLTVEEGEFLSILPLRKERKMLTAQLHGVNKHLLKFAE